MATINEILKISNNDMKKAEEIALYLIETKGKNFLLDLDLIYSFQGKWKESWEVCQEAEKYMADNPRFLFNKGGIVMMHGDLLEGFKLMNEGRKENLWGNRDIGSYKPIWNGESLRGKYLLFNNEAGFGDNIIFIRFIKELHELGAKIIVSGHPELASVISRIPGVSAVVQPEAMLGIYHDYWLPSMLAPVPLKTTFEDLSGESYITPDPNYVKKYKSIINNGNEDKLKIGIRWLGTQTNDQIGRIFPPELLFDSVNLPNTKVFSLQRDLEKRTDGLTKGSPDWIVDTSPFLKTWEDTIGIISNLDLVITSCTSVAHISAALGKPTWIITPLMMYFVWVKTGNKSPWYDSVTLFRQEKYGSWKEPFEKIKSELKGMLNE